MRTNLDMKTSLKILNNDNKGNNSIMESGSESLKIIVKGISTTERRLLSAAVGLSARRKPRLELMDAAELTGADVVIVDISDEDARRWSDSNDKELKNKSVVWVGARPRHRGHVKLSRPVLWINLPIILSRALDEFSTVKVQKKIKAPPLPNVDSFDKVGGRVLVVDDSVAVRQHLTSFLETNGYKVTAVKSGDDAVEIVKEQPFDLVLMDVLMPGIDGYTACRKIKSKKIDGRTLPVIMLTGKTSPFDKIRGKMAGCNAYLTKPVKIEKLKQTLADNVLK